MGRVGGKEGVLSLFDVRRSGAAMKGQPMPLRWRWVLYQGEMAKVCY
jgi:hypothetical protein